MNVIRKRKQEPRSIPYSIRFVTLILLMIANSQLFAERIITPGEDISQIIQDESTENTFLVQTGTGTPTVYEINKPIIVNRSIVLKGVDNSATPSTNQLPTQVVIKGNNVFADIIKSGDFEPPDLIQWKTDINPPDPTAPAYSIIEENTRALSPTHLALFKGINEPLISDQISQEFTFPFDPINTGPLSTIGDPEVSQNITLSKVSTIIETLETRPISFPEGTEPTGISYAESILPLVNPLPPNLSGLVSAQLRFDITRDNGPVGVDDIVEIMIKIGAVESPIFTIPMSVISSNTWETWNFDILSLIQQFSGGETPLIALTIRKLGKGNNSVYFDNFRVFLNVNIITLEIPIYCGDFDNFPCSQWVGIGNWAIVPDPIEPPPDRCLMLGPSPMQTRPVWVEFYVRTEVFSGKPNDRLKIFFDGITPSQVFAEVNPGNWIPIPEYKPELFANSDQYIRILAEIPSALTNDIIPHRIVFISEVSPCALNPDAPIHSTTAFVLDDVNFLVGPINNLKPPEPGYVIPNGDFEAGADASWVLTTTPIIPDRSINTVIISTGGHNAPFSAHLGGIPPAKISFYVKPVNLDNAYDCFTVWLGNDENLIDKVIYSSRISGMPPLGVWTKIERWLVPPLLDESDSNFDLHIKSHIITSSPGSYILFDSFCVSPFGGLGNVISPNDVCFQNAIQNPSFEIDPDTSWNKNTLAVAMGPIHCYDPALSDCILSEPPITGTRALRFGGISSKPVLTFWLKILNSTNNSFSKLEILIDGQIIKTINATDNTFWTDYQPVTIRDELTPFLDRDVHRLTIRVNPECYKESTKYLLDDFCLGYEVFVISNKLICFPNILLDPSFEDGPTNTLWETFPNRDVIKGGPIGFPFAHTGVWYAELKQSQPDIRILWQEGINIPAAATKLQFFVRVLKGSSPGKDKFEVYWDDLNSPPVWSSYANALNNDRWVLKEVPLPTSPSPHTLYFVYENCRATNPSVFMIDDVAIVRDRFPLIQVNNGGDLCIESISLTKGTVGILNSGGTSKVYRCFLGPYLDEGIVVMPNAVGAISQTVVHGNSMNGITNQGTTAILQCTIRSNDGIGVVSRNGGNAYVMTSLIWENQSGGLFAEDGATLTSGWNLIHPDVTSGITPVGSPIGISPQSISFIDSPWLGKLRTPILAGVSLPTIINNENYIPSSLSSYFLNTTCGTTNIFPLLDFENDIRNVFNLQVGADEVDIGAILVFWYYCKVSEVLDRKITGRPRDIGIGNNFNVEVGIRGNTTLAGSTLYLVPEEYVPYIDTATNQLAQAEKLPSALKKSVEIIDASNQRGRAGFVIDDLFMTDEDGITFTTNGRARVYLNVGQIFMGIGTVYEILMRFDKTNTEFIIDTVPPRLREDILDLTAGGIVFQSNDAIAPPNNYTYPQDWCPATLSPLAYSYGTLNAQTPPAHIFFNNLPTTPLLFGLQCAFYDPYPMDANGNIRNIEVSGFNYDKPAINVNGTSAVFDLITNGPIYVGYEPYPGLGCAIIIPMSDIANVLSRSGNPGLTYSMMSDPIQTGYPLWQTARTEWIWSNLQYSNDWHIRLKFGIRDLSGNQFYEPLNLRQDELNIWWMRDPVLDITSVPRFGEWTTNPQISWRLIRSVSEIPANAEPCVPIFGIRLWTARDPFNYNSTSWIPVDGFTTAWGWVVGRESMDKNTPIVLSDGSVTTLGNIISQRKYCGALFMAMFVGADEAGNVTELSSQTAVLRNPCDFDIDTNLQVNTWWNRCIAIPATWREINYNFGERDFGASQRVSLPLYEDACDYRIEMQIKMSVVIPNIGYAISGYGFDVQIFEDSNLVAGGTVNMLQGNTTADIYIPSDLLSLPEGNQIFNLNWYTNVSSFLNAPPGKCETQQGLLIDRLGDEGSPEKGYRKRDVKYDIVVRAFAQDMTTGALVTDSTPAKFSVTVYPPVGDVERAITAPSQPKEEQKVKLFQKE